LLADGHCVTALDTMLENIETVRARHPDSLVPRFFDILDAAAQQVSQGAGDQFVSDIKLRAFPPEDQREPGGGRQCCVSRKLTGRHVPGQKRSRRQQFTDFSASNLVV